MKSSQAPTPPSAGPKLAAYVLACSTPSRGYQLNTISLCRPNAVYAGKDGLLPALAKSKTHRKVLFDDLSYRQYENEADFEKLNVDLCRITAPKGRQWPTVVPSPEVYGGVAGWRVQPTQSAADGAGQNNIDRIEDRNVYEAYRWQFSPLHERATALEMRTDEIVDALTHVNGAQTTGMTFGKICPEVDAHRINKASVMLELQGAGKDQGTHAGKLTLDLRETTNYSVFSGQIVGVKGVSIREGVLNVTEIASRAPPPPVKVRRNNAEALAAVQSEGGPLRVMVAVGPFTAPNNLEFEPLQLLMAEASEKRVDVVVLMGPFFDAEHELVKGMVSSIPGDETQLSIERLWVEYVVPIIDLYMTQPGAENITLVLQPSTSDILCEPVYPQWPMAASLFLTLVPPVRARIITVPNPASLVIGDLLWCMTTADPVFGINMDDATNAPNDPDIKDRYAFLARHMLDQRSFYPLYPAMVTPTDPKLQGMAAEAQQAMRGMPLEVTRLWNLGLPACPDVMILPSKLGVPQGRALGQHTVLINPGQLASKKSYALVLIHPDTGLASVEADPADPEYVTNRAQERVRVDIERIDAAAGAK